MQSVTQITLYFRILRYFEQLDESPKRIYNKTSLYRLFLHPIWLWRFSLTDTLQMHSVTQRTLYFRILSYFDMIVAILKRLSSKISSFRLFSHTIWLWRFSLTDRLQMQSVTQITLYFRILRYFEMIVAILKRLSSKISSFCLFSHTIWLLRFSLKDTLEMHSVTQRTLYFRISSYFEQFAEVRSGFKIKQACFAYFRILSDCDVSL